MTDAQGRPRLLMLSAGNVNDMTMAGALIGQASGRFDRLIADRGYDTNAIRAAVAAQGAQVVIPSTTSRRAPIPYDQVAYRTRNLIEPSGAGSRTGGASPPDMTSSLGTSSPQQ